MASDATDIRLSVALVTRNRPKMLDECLSSWSKQTVPPFEIIVSDDSATDFADDTRQVVEQHGFTYVRGPLKGLYANRNNATLACRGTHILSADDDHTHPPDYVEQVVALINKDRRRIWTFGERPSWEDANTPLSCPTELHRSGAGQPPADSSDCAAISDGATVYPRDVFDSGLRYDSTYSFGGLWYLWGRILKKAGWRISYADTTFIWHHAFTESRLDDPQALKDQLECMMYVLFVNAFWIDRSLPNIFWAFAYLFKRMLFKDSIVYYKVKVRLGLDSAARVLRLAWTYPERKEAAGKLEHAHASR